jgi:uncharacterized protein (TIGR03066 family)
MKSAFYKTVFITMLASLFIITGCTKYDDGPLFSIKSKTGRLEGEWKLVKMNGEDINSNDDQLYYQFEKDGKCIVTNEYDDDVYSYEGTWVWENSKEVIEIEVVFQDETERIDYTVFRLTNNELWVEDDDNNELEFEKQ